MMEAEEKSKELYAKYGKEEEEKKLMELIHKIAAALQNTDPDKYKLPGKRGIMLRVSKESILDNNNPKRAKDDCYVKLEDKKDG